MDARRRVTYAEYLELEAGSDVRHEYVGGEVIAMAGGSVEHGRLISRLTGLLWRALQGRPCVVLPADVRVRIRASDRATYPDLHVVCSEIERDPDDDHAVVNPTVIIEVLASLGCRSPAAPAPSASRPGALRAQLEVLSDTTAAADRGDKFADYRRLRSLREYVLVSQRERRIDVYRRDGRRWHLDEYGSGERVAFESIAVELAVDDVYVDGLGPIVDATTRP